MLQKSVRSAVLFLVLLSIGCSRNGDVENPDDGIRVTTLEAIHGRVGHLIEFTIGNKNNPVVDRVVLRIHDRDISDAVLYISLAHTVVNPDSTTGLIAFLNDATDISLVPVLPEGVKQRGGIILGDKSNPPFWIYLKVTTPTDTKYWSVRGNLWLDRRDWFLTEVRKPPKIIDTRPARVTAISYYLDETLTQPLTDMVMVGDAVYTKVEFSKDVPITLANDSRARPRISSSAGLQTFQYRMKPRGSILESGDAQPYQNTKHSFVCKYVVQAEDIDRAFFTYVGDGTDAGDLLRVTARIFTDQDFIGKVYVPAPKKLLSSFTRSIVRPIAGVTVTIMAGARSGERTTTDGSGQYFFLNVAEDNMHLLVEKRGFEPKEVIVHRSRPTTLPHGVRMNYPGDVQNNPGVILMGHAWPDEVRFILEETLMVSDLLYIDGDEPNPSDPLGGVYNKGIAVSYKDGLLRGLILHIVAHEIAHAHQHAVVSADGSGDVQDWVNTPEGISFREAKEKDWKEVGKTVYDLHPTLASNLLENAAETSVIYWGMDRRYYERPEMGKLEKIAPNRSKWAEEWLKKK